MLRFLLDTDHVTLYEQGSTPVVQQITARPLGVVGVSAVTVEEALRGRLAHLARARDGPTRIRRYAQLVETTQLFHRFPIVPFDQAAENQFQHLLALRLGVGTQDLKIASVALAQGLVLVTRNRRDFTRIPGLVLDDWSV
jgi:tRNA(fMet)-specific endonuclease VapC